MVESLFSTSLAAEPKTQEVKLLFRNIAKIFDVAKCSGNLPKHLEEPLQEFKAHLNIIVLNYIECHVKATASTSNSSTMLSHSKKPIYAAIIEALPSKPKNLTNSSCKAEGHRLFVRVTEGVPAQIISPYALMLEINSFLK